MFSIAARPLFRFWPDVELPGFSKKAGRGQGDPLDLETMPESLQRDLGILEGRPRRGEREEEDGAFTAMRLSGTLRSL